MFSEYIYIIIILYDLNKIASIIIVYDLNKIVSGNPKKI